MKVCFELIVGRVGFLFFLLLTDVFLGIFFLFAFFFFNLHNTKPLGRSGLFQKGESELRKEVLLYLRTWEVGEEKR